MNPPPLALPIVIVLVAIFFIAISIRRLRTLHHSQCRKWRRITERVVLSFIVLVCAFLACTTTFNAAALRYYRAIYSAPGKIYSVDGHDMHLYCTGGGSPTLVLEAGGGNDSLTWTKVQPELSNTTRVCSYDRAGFGWSTQRPPPRDANTIAGDLHGLLQQAGIRGPIVLMGHSRAGLYIRAYNRLYPEQVKGLIFIDVATPLDDDRLSPQLRAASPYSKSLYYLLASMATLGLHRVVGACSADPIFDQATGKRFAQLECGKNVTPIFQEFVTTRQNGEETIHTGPYGDLPILIFSRDPELEKQNSGLPPKLALEQSVVWNEEQEELKGLSTRSRRIIAKGSGHPIQIERADLVTREVAIFIEQIRDNGSRSDYGTTTTE